MLLNAHGKVPMFANPGTFVQPPKQHIWMDEQRLVAALEGTQWYTYYEVDARAGVRERQCTRMRLCRR